MGPVLFLTVSTGNLKPLDLKGFWHPSIVIILEWKKVFQAITS